MSPSYTRITEVRTKNGFQLLGEPLFEGSLPQDVNGTPQQDITITAVNGHQFELPAAGGNGMQTATIGMVFAVIRFIRSSVCYKKSKNFERTTLIEKQNDSTKFGAVLSAATGLHSASCRFGVFCSAGRDPTPDKKSIRIVL